MRTWKIFAIFGAGVVVGTMGGIWAAERMMSSIASQAVEANLLNARRAADSGRFMEQLRSSASALARDPDNPSALMLLGDLFSKPTSRDVAREAYRDALKALETQAQVTSSPQERSRLEFDAGRVRERLTALGDK
jgi:Flp pilus assembly protein TadD